VKKPTQHTTGFLFSTPCFLSGMGSILSIEGNYYEFNSSENGFEADEMALTNDFRMVGQDIENVLNEIKSDKNTLVEK